MINAAGNPQVLLSICPLAEHRHRWCPPQKVENLVVSFPRRQGPASRIRGGFCRVCPFHVRRGRDDQPGNQRRRRTWHGARLRRREASGLLPTPGRVQLQPAGDIALVHLASVALNRRFQWRQRAKPSVRDSSRSVQPPGEVTPTRSLSGSGNMTPVIARPDARRGHGNLTSR